MQEERDHSEVSETIRYLTEAIGPRLTGSREFEAAARWARARMIASGLDSVDIQTWGPFGRRWSAKKYFLEAFIPEYMNLAGVPLAWSGPTKGRISADAIVAPLDPQFPEDPKLLREALVVYRAKWHGQLRNKVILLSSPPAIQRSTDPSFKRYTDAQLTMMAQFKLVPTRTDLRSVDDIAWPAEASAKSKLVSTLSPALRRQLAAYVDGFIADRAALLASEGVAGVLVTDGRAHDGAVFAEAAGAFKCDSVLAPPTFALQSEQYNRIFRAVSDRRAVRVVLELDSVLSKGDVQGWNVIGEIRGREFPEEIIMVGAHLDSWHAGTGATDNAAGSAIVMEAMRLLSVLHLKLKRTVRVALWGGEEQGLLGSRAYVARNFPPGVPASEKLLGYFNVDGGGGRIRGISVQELEPMRALFERWVKPLYDIGAKVVTSYPHGGSDQYSFTSAGLPGFYFVQDPLDYEHITHHSSVDTLEHILTDDLQQAAIVVAAVAYQAANDDDLTLRK